MTDKLQKLFNKRNKIKEEQIKISEERNSFNYLSKNFNITALIAMTASIILMIPMALYTVPIIPSTTTFAGETMKGFVPILSKTASLDLLMYPAFIGGTGFLASSAALALGNLLYFIPLKIIGKSIEKNLKKERRKINNLMIEESKKNINNINNINNIKPIFQQHNSNYKYSYNKMTSNHNEYQNEERIKEIVRKAQERIKKRQLKKMNK